MARGSRRHDVVVDPMLEVGVVLAGVLGEVPPSSRWEATTLTGRVLVDGDRIGRVGLVDGSVIVAVLVTGPAATSVPGPEPVTDGGRSGRTAPGPGSPGGTDRRDRSGGRATSSVAVRVTACCGLALSLVAVMVAGLPRVGVPPVGAAVLALALAAGMSRVVPDLVLRLPAAAGPGSPGTGDGSVHDNTAVLAWVRLVAGRQLSAHLALLVVVLVSAGVLLASSTGMPVAALGRGLAAGVDANAPPGSRGSASVLLPLSGTVLMSLVASALVLVGSARGRGRDDRWLLRAASAVALVPVLSVAAAWPSTAFAVIAAYGFVGLAWMALRPARGRRRPGLARARLARGVDVLVVIAALPLACWASGLLGGVRALAHAMLS